MDILEDLAARIYKRYPYPQPWWSKTHYTKRCTEIYAAEQALLRCMDKIYIDDPVDTINDYIFELEVCKNKTDNAQAIINLSIMIRALEELVAYLKLK